jgi:hypothetical protein
MKWNAPKFPRDEHPLVLKASQRLSKVDLEFFSR